MKIVRSDNGMTLIEVLLALVITVIVSTILYSVFVTGIKLYQKIAIEGQIRTDADYIATMLLNEMYENQPNYIEKYSEGDAEGIRLVRYKHKEVNGYFIEDSNEIIVDKLIYFENNQFYIKDVLASTDNIVQISSDSSVHTTLEIDGLSEKSYININQCTKKNADGKCINGIISLNLVLEDSKIRSSSILQIEPLVLKSTFGF